MSATEAAASAASTFRLFEEGAPQLLPFGWHRLDRAIGGGMPRHLAVLAASVTGLGKSRALLLALSNTGDGAVLLEDDIGVTGARWLALVTGIDSNRIMKKALSARELQRIRSAMETPALVQPQFYDCVAGDLTSACDGIKTLAARGCKRVWVDYLQKIRGIKEDRRAEVGHAMTLLHRTGADEGVAVGLVSQSKRVMVLCEDGKTWRPAQAWDLPDMGWLKESGDIENEARHIFFLHQQREGAADLRLFAIKASYGGAGSDTILRPDSSGTLREVKEDSL